MSESDSFLNEVTEEVRRDRMVSFLRRNAVWIAAAVIFIVGGATLMELRKASIRAEAESQGAAVWAALQTEDDGDRLAALEEIEIGTPPGAAFIGLQQAAAAIDAGEIARASEILQRVAGNTEAPVPLRDVAKLKLVSLGEAGLPRSERLDILIPMVAEGHPMRSLALEQRALVHLEAGDSTAAATDLADAATDPSATNALRQRATAVLSIIGFPDPDTETSDG